MSASGTAGSAPLMEIYKIHFDFVGGRAIHLLDPADNRLIGMSPEWVRESRDEFVAYVRGTRPNIQAVFRGNRSVDGEYRIGADGTQVQIQERLVRLSFDPATGLSDTYEFEAIDQLPSVIGVHDIDLNWYACRQSNTALQLRVGDSSHRIGTSWQSLAVAPLGEANLETWVYKPLMEWTCEWAAGLDDELAICNAILKNLPASGLRYGEPADTIQDLLLNQGGMCGIWYQAFQQMAQCQGVFVYRRCFVVDLRQVNEDEEYWWAIVIKNGGLNQLQPTHAPSTFNDHDGEFPIPTGTKASILSVDEARYRFWGAPLYYWGDGHCINFLIHDEEMYLFDACFGIGPIKIDAPLPADNLDEVQGGAALAPFKSAYFDEALDYMLGTVKNGDSLLRTVPYPPITNGMTVRTVNIPNEISGLDGLTFRWGG